MLDFISSQLWLVIAAVLSGGYLIAPKLMPGGVKNRSIGPSEVVTLINREGASVVDLRTSEEFESGSIVGAKNIPLDSLESRAAELKKIGRKPIVFMCASGARSRSAQKVSSKLGLEEAFILNGGIAAWKQMGLPTTK
jgi:rhodanese-related sulfurtransferase